MNKMDEQILVVDRGRLFDNEELSFQGVLIDSQKISSIMSNFKSYFETRRGDAENNTKWKQPIPYVVIRRDDEVFLYKRLKAGGEKRLHDQLSIGVGGHMNKIRDEYEWDDSLLLNAYREVHEELDISIHCAQDPDMEILGLINDDTNDVGRVHIGILLSLNLPKESNVEVKELDVLEGYWIRTRDLKKTPLFENLETWSQYVVEVL